MIGMVAAVMLAGAAVAEPIQVQLQVGRTKGAIYNPWTLGDDQVELRSFRGKGIKDGDFVAPTIRIAPGQRLNINLENRLEPCSEAQREEHRCYNDTNLHTHGLWVSPSGNSDNVLISIAPGERFRYEYDIPADHPAGTFWYHPHRHGSGYVQVGSGMAGALIVTGNRAPTPDRPGDVDILLKDEFGHAFPERVLLFQQIQYGCLDDKGEIEGDLDKEKNYVRPFKCSKGRMGKIESSDNDWDWIWSGRFTGINGKVQPELPPARAGVFERWRLIHGGTRERVVMKLYRLDARAPSLRTIKAADQEGWLRANCRGEALPMWQIAMDGLTRSEVRRADEMVLFPGERTDLLVRLPEEGRYCLVQDTSRLDPTKNPSRMLAVIEAKGHAAAAGDPNALLQAQLIHSAERTLAGREQAVMRARVIGELKAGMKLGSFVWHKPVAAEEVSNYREAIVNIVEGAKAAYFHVNGRAYEHGRIDQLLLLGKAEEWRAISLLGAHPLHMHVNPFQVISIEDPKGRDVTDPNSEAFDPDYAGLKGEWKDTVILKQDHRIAFRTRYERFTGDFVTHCHIMFHGDHGMMQNLRIAAEEEGSAQHSGH